MSARTVSRLEPKTDHADHDHGDHPDAPLKHRIQATQEVVRGQGQTSLDDNPQAG